MANLSDHSFDEELKLDGIDGEVFGVGTNIRTFDITDTKTTGESHEVTLNIVLDSGYELEGAKLTLTYEDFEAYETNDLKEAVKYALGIFN